MKNKVYNQVTMWLTLSVIFFLVQYLTGWLQVVTLGGLVAGAFIEGVFMLLGLALVKLVVSKEFCRADFKQALAQHADLAKALVVMAALSLEGAMNICRLLPGYELNLGIWHGAFLLLVYPAAALYLQKLMMAKEEADDGN